MSAVDPKPLRVVSAGKEELDRKLGGGIPIGSLTLIEGQSDAGKSVMCQHLAYGSLTSGQPVAYYTTENTVKSLLVQMRSLGLEVMDHFLVDWLRIYPLALPTNKSDVKMTYAVLLDHISKLPDKCTTILVDSLTTLIGHSDVTSVIDYFTSAKRLCEMNKTVFLVVHSSAFEEQTLIRVRSLCDAHLKLRLDTVGEQLVKTLEVCKIRNADKATGNIISFDVEPGLGMHIIPISRAKA